MPTYKHSCRKGSVLLFSFLFVLALNVQISLAAPKTKSIFSRPKWIKKAAPKEVVSSSSSVKEKENIKKFYYPSQIRISPELAKVQESYQGKTKKLIIHIQDAHCHYEAQKKVSQVLEKLISNYGLGLILVEGGSGDVSLSYLRNYGTQELRDEVAEEYLKKGEIAGEEYLDIISDLPFRLYGIENDDLYNAHLDSFWKVESFKEKAIKSSSDLKLLADNLKKHIYNKHLITMEEKKGGYEKEKISLTDYYQYLQDSSKKFGLDLSPFPNFKNFIEAASFEKNIKTEEITRNCKSLVTRLTEVLPKKKLKQLLAKSAKFKLEKIESQDYYLFLKMLAQSKHLNLKSYPQFYNYLNYLELSERIDGVKLIKEVKSVEEGIKEKLFKNNEERKLNEISENLRLLTNLINLQMTPDEYELYSAKKSDFKLSSWLEFLNARAAKYKLNKQTLDTSLIDNNLETLESYYQAALKRDAVLVENTIAKMDEDKEAIAVLIAGGFHTPQLTRLFKESGFSYLVVAPKITEESDHEIYLSVLKNRKPLGFKK
ncbi:MAG: hypothetical protein U9Q24_01705 [Candidatus Ratteibacteria bacterium]|nr:hypothetical protein [Candidatus Ratteibacteria bacterium]